MYIVIIRLSICSISNTAKCVVHPMYPHVITVQRASEFDILCSRPPYIQSLSKMALRTTVSAGVLRNWFEFRVNNAMTFVTTGTDNGI